jgi:hypothetical protein
VLLRGGIAEIVLACFIEPNVPAARSNFAKLIDREIMQYGKQPGTDVAVAALIPTTDGALKTVLHQIVGIRAIANKCTGIAAERGYQRFDLQQHVFHGALRLRLASIFHHCVCT